MFIFFWTLLIFVGWEWPEGRKGCTDWASSCALVIASLYSQELAADLKKKPGKYNGYPTVFEGKGHCYNTSRYGRESQLQVTSKSQFPPMHPIWHFFKISLKSLKHMSPNFLWPAKMSAKQTALCLRQRHKPFSQFFFSHSFLIP